MFFRDPTQMVSPPKDNFLAKDANLGENMANEEKKIKIKVEFGGGLELLFQNIRHLNLELPRTKDGKAFNIAHLIEYLRNNHLKDRRAALFTQEGTVTPGILVLVNDADWELEGREEYELCERDEIVFISTLHGG
ncbi:Ubiquitin-related modifier 1 [Neolecta irregularis DAH-3]|uniref:Ubiquitin-related modifier 1 n=1 Tax=Neolecta irregularis (strain DAH-3) TaxID=1198029 RepID=A0A1U7LHY4_NEOID|nr:Ubiquitin-related modifier 1 [Neolecta irregularis DAH-3]|eukprot:OLL22270.1 Ubiquitin-related modifier 1 [Neolecta irregularis DAH-3]